MSAKLVGEYQLAKEENFDAYLKAMGVGFLVRKTVCFVNNTIVIQESNGVWVCKSSTPFKSMTQEFTSGTEVEEHWPDGSHVKATHVMSDNKWVSDVVSLSVPGVKSTIERIFTEDGFEEHSVCGDVRSKRIFTRKK